MKVNVALSGALRKRLRVPKDRKREKKKQIKKRKDRWKG